MSDRLDPTDASGRIDGVVRLLDADPELAAGLTDAELAEARRHVVLPAVLLPPGAWRPETLRDANGVRGELFGFIVLTGAMTLDIGLGDHSSRRLLGPRDLFLLADAQPTPLPIVWRWSTLARTRLAILDERLLMFARAWPPLHGEVLKRAAQQSRLGLIHQAISQLPRVEDRLLAYFWAFAERHGVAQGERIFIPLNVTHRSLATMVGAQRPTVSLGLRRLVREELIHAHPDGWLLEPGSLQSFGSGGVATR